MKLEEILGLIYGDQTYINLFSEDAEHLLESYDGRNSLTDTYDKCEVCQLELAYEGRAINIYLEDRDCLPLWKRQQRMKEANKRDQWLYGEDYNPRFYSAGTRYFELTSDALEEAIRLGFISEDERQNNSPTVRELLDFAKKSEWDWSFEGYVVSPERPDCRMTIDGIYANDTEFTVEDVCKFAEAFRYADEFDVGPYNARAWWD